LLVLNGDLFDTRLVVMYKTDTTTATTDDDNDDDDINCSLFSC